MAKPKFAVIENGDPCLAPAHLHRPEIRGFHVVYREGETNHCPGCGRTHWYVGRLMAECAFCTTALPLAGNKGEIE